MIGATIVSVVIIIVILEISRYFRLLNRSIEELQEKVANIEKLLKKQNN